MSKDLFAQCLPFWRGWLRGWVVLFGMKWHSDIQMHISHTFHLFPFLFIFVFHVLCILKVGLQDFFFLSRHTSNLLFSLPLCYLCYLWIYNVGLVINVRILQPNLRHLGLLYMNAIAQSAVIRPRSCAPSPHFCHSPLCLQEGMYFLHFSTVFPDFIYNINNNQHMITYTNTRSAIHYFKLDSF